MRVVSPRFLISSQERSVNPGPKKNLESRSAQYFIEHVAITRMMKHHSLWLDFLLPKAKKAFFLW